VKALSLTQPWATLVAIGAKRIETRSWPTGYRGVLAIHAAKGFPAWAREACDEEPFYGELVKTGCLWPVGDETLTYKAAERFAALPLGAIVAVAHLDAVCRTEAIHWPGVTALHGIDPERELAFGDYAPGRFAWRLSAVIRLANPIPCRGALGLWDVPADIARQLEAR
jgi:activating signal cointegrator 1